MKSENYQLLKQILQEEGTEAVRNALLSIYQEIQREQCDLKPQRLMKRSSRDRGGR